MIKYVVSVAHEIDGHAGSTTGYLQVDRRLTRKEKLKAISAMFDEDTEFVESEYHAHKANESDMDFYGTLVTKISDDLTYEEGVSVSMAVLPSRMTKGRIYLSYARTG